MYLDAVLVLNTSRSSTYTFRSPHADDMHHLINHFLKYFNSPSAVAGADDWWAVDIHLKVSVVVSSLLISFAYELRSRSKMFFSTKLCMRHNIRASFLWDVKIAETKDNLDLDYLSYFNKKHVRPRTRSFLSNICNFLVNDSRRRTNLISVKFTKLLKLLSQNKQNTVQNSDNLPKDSFKWFKKTTRCLTKETTEYREINKLGIRYNEARFNWEGTFAFIKNEPCYFVMPEFWFWPQIWYYRCTRQRKQPGSLNIVNCGCRFSTASRRYVPLWLSSLPRALISYPAYHVEEAYRHFRRVPSLVPWFKTARPTLRETETDCKSV